MSRLAPALLLVLLAAAPPDLEGQAESPVIGGNLASARGRALQGAQQDCLGRAIAARLGAERAAREAQRIAPLLARAPRFLATYRVLEEGEQAQRFRVRLACTLDEAQLRRALETALGPLVAPASAITCDVRVELTPAGRTLLAGTLRERAALALGRAGVTVRAGEGNVLVVRLESREEPAVRGLGWPARRARGSVMSGPTALGAQVEAFASAPTEEEAERVAAERALDQAVGEALPLIVPATPAARLELRVRGLTGVTDLQELRRALDELGAGARLRSVDAGEVLLDMVAPAGGAPALAASLRARAFTRLALARQRISGGVLWLDFVRR